MKWAILFTVFMICTMFGVWVDEDRRKRVVELGRLIYVFEVLKAEIDYQLTPLKEACINVSTHEKEGIKDLFTSFADKLEKKESLNIKEMWLDAIDDSRVKLHLKNEDYIVLASFADSCGYLDKNMQRRNLEMLIEKLEHIRVTSEAQYEKSSKLNKTLGMLVGAVIVIMFI